MTKSRTKKLPRYQSFRRRSRINKSELQPIPSSWALFKQSVNLLWANKKAVGLFLLVLVALYVIFVRGLSGTVNLADIKDQLKESTGGDPSAFTSSTALFGVLLANASATSSDVASLYQAIILIIGSLAFIWLLRQITADKPTAFRTRDAFYLGMAPLIPFLIVLGVISLEFIPMGIGSFLLNSISAETIGATGMEIFVTGVIAISLAVLSLYLVSGSILGLYIVTLPGVGPMKALRSSTKLLTGRRWAILRKLLVLAIIVLILLAFFFIPILLVLPNGLAFIAEGLFFLAMITGFAIGHSYLYNLYRSLL